MIQKIKSKVVLQLFSIVEVEFTLPILMDMKLEFNEKSLYTMKNNYRWRFFGILFVYKIIQERFLLKIQIQMLKKRCYIFSLIFVRKTYEKPFITFSNLLYKIKNWMCTYYVFNYEIVWEFLWVLRFNKNNLLKFVIMYFWCFLIKNFWKKC